MADLLAIANRKRPPTLAPTATVTVTLPPIPERVELATDTATIEEFNAKALTFDELVDREARTLEASKLTVALASLKVAEDAVIVETRDALGATIGFDLAVDTPQTVTIIGVIGTDGDLELGPPTIDTIGRVLSSTLDVACSTGEVGLDGLIARCGQIKGAVKETLPGARVEVKADSVTAEVVGFAIEVWAVPGLPADHKFKRTRVLRVAPGQVL